MMFEDLLNKTTNYLKAIKASKNYKVLSIRELSKRTTRKDGIIKIFLDGISKETIDIELPFVKLHGDLISFNILLNKNNNEIKYIDFERSDYFIFFYDIFLLIWLEFTIKNDDRYLDFFVDEKYDVRLAEMFKIFDLEYKPENKIDYINIFF